MSFGSLLLIMGDSPPRTVEIERPTITIGSAADCDVVLNDELAAAVHAQIASDESSNAFMLLVDSSATRVDGRIATRGQVLPLKPTSRIFIGRTTLVFQRKPAAPAPGVTPRLNIATAAPPAAAQPRPAQQPASPAQPAPAASEPQIVMIMKTIPPSEVVKPGQSISYVIEVINRSQLVDAVALNIEGIAADWVTILPPRRQLHVGDSGEFELRVRPPQAAASVARSYPLRIIARFDKQKSVSASDERLIDVEPFDAFTIEPLDPESRRAWRNASYTFTLQNNSNHPQSFSLRGRERERAIDFSFLPPKLALEPGHHQEVQVQASFAREHRRLFGDRKDYTFTVDATPDQAAGLPNERSAEQSTKTALRVSGTLTQQPPLSQWVSLLALGFTLLSCLCVVLSVVLARVAPDLYGRSIGSVVDIVLQPTATATATPALPTPAPAQPTLVPPTPPPTQDVEAAFAPLKTAQEEQYRAKQTAIAGMGDDQKTALALQYAVTATIIAISQAQTSTSVAQTSAAQLAEQQTQFSEIQTANSLHATETQLAIPTATFTPTPSETPPPTLTPPADIEVGFAKVNGTSVTTRTVMSGNEYLEQGVSLCFFGLVTPTETSYPGPLAFNVNAAEVARCRPPQSFYPYSDQLASYTPVLYPAFPSQAAVNSKEPFITADQGSNEFRDNLFGVITLQFDATDVRINVFHAGPGTATYTIDALDASGTVIGTAQQDLGVPGPYTLSVTAPQAIRQVIISGQHTENERTLLQGPLLITKIEVNSRRR